MAIRPALSRPRRRKYSGSPQLTACRQLGQTLASRRLQNSGPNQARKPPSPRRVILRRKSLYSWVKNHIPPSQRSATAAQGRKRSTPPRPERLP